jgi:DNA ligase-1
MLFKEICALLSSIENLTSRNEITDVLIDFYKNSKVRDAQIFSYLVVGRVAPSFVDAEFNMSEKSILKVLSEIAHTDLSEARKGLGDIGLVAEQYVGSTDTELDLESVYSELWNLINTGGTGSVAEKQFLVKEIVNKMSPVEAKYFVRIIVGKLRLGVSSKTFLDVFSFLKNGDKSLRSELDLVYGVDPDLGALTYRILKDQELSVEPTPGIPLLSRLVERVGSFEEVFERLGEKIIVQPKFDGLRCQAHKGVNYSELDKELRIWSGNLTSKHTPGGMFETPSRGDVKLFSRNLEDLTEMFPEVVEVIESLDCESCILDGEVIGWDDEKDTFAPFQQTMTRKRKHGVGDAMKEVPVKYFTFDVMYIDGKSLALVDTSERVQILKGISPDDRSVFRMAETDMITSLEELNDMFDQSSNDGLEGLIVKKLEGGYEPGNRNYDWIKLKKSMDKKLVDTVDVVIMGYYAGSGKRSSLGMGALLGGVYNPDTNRVESVTKIGTGITDEQWGEINSKLAELRSEKMPSMYDVDTGLHPDAWVEPRIVCSVEADEITKSKVHKAAVSLYGDSGLALRFPRLIEFDRDKNIEDATSPSELKRLYDIS